MTVADHDKRADIWSATQHPFKHESSDFAYNNPSVPGVSEIEGALDYLFAVIYPKSGGSVANVAALPPAPPLNTYYRVEDDGDGKSAGYVYQRIDGITQWVKRYDIDWAADTILAETEMRTQYLYVSKWGATDKDENAADFAGDLAGQRIYGGDQANQHLILYANSGDAVGQTGYVQFGDNVRPLVDNSYGLGTATYRFTNGYFSTLLNVGTLSMGSGSITDTSGNISFDNENLSTTGNVSMANLIGTGYLNLSEIATPANPVVGQNRIYFKADGRLYRLDDTGSETLVGLDFTSTNDNRLVRSDGATGTALQESVVTLDDAGAMSGLTQLDIGSIRITGNTISTEVLNTDLILSANGTGVVRADQLQVDNLTNNRLIDVQAGRLASSGIVITGNNLSGITRLDVDNLRLDGNTLSTTNLDGNLILSPNGVGLVSTTASIVPDTNGVDTLGQAALRFSDLFLSGSIGNGTNSISMTSLLSFRDALTGVVDGAALFYDTATGRWLPSLPDSEIDHGGLTGILDDDHTQYLLLAGRTGGQTAIGGIAANNDLILESTSHATKGFVKVSSNLAPTADAVFGGTWTGTNLGDPSFRFNNVYSAGEFIGFRAQNSTFAGLPAASAQNPGRLAWTTDQDSLYVDNGGAWQRVGRKIFRSDIAFNGVETTKDVDVSASVDDARNCIVQLLDNNNNFERIQATIQATSATNIRIITNVALPAGSYRLIAIE
jgi:hypothetical protein